MLDFDDSSFIKEYESFIPNVFREKNTSNATPIAIDELEDPVVVDYIPEVEYNSEGEAYDIIYVSSDESSYEDEEELKGVEIQENHSHKDDLVVISSDEEDEFCSSATYMIHGRKSRPPRLTHRRTTRRQYPQRTRKRVISGKYQTFIDTKHFEKR